jgi:glycosyltransferase involved in cell wall biosynthesis
LPPLEVLVIDDASTDDSVEVVERFARRHPIVRFLRNERNLGVVRTLNRGLTEARGELVYCGAADDLVEPCLAESVQSLSERYPQAGIYFGRHRYLDANDKELWTDTSTRWDEETFAPPERFLNEYLEVIAAWHSSSPATTYRKSYLEEQGGFRPELGHWADTFAIRSIGLKYGAASTPKLLVSVRFVAESYSESSQRNPRLMFDTIARAAWLMRSPEFRDCFPEPHVARWEKAWRDHVLWDHFCTTHPSLARSHCGLPPVGRPPSRPRRLWARLVLAYYWRRMQAYSPDLSCYPAAAR